MLWTRMITLTSKSPNNMFFFHCKCTNSIYFIQGFPSSGYCLMVNTIHGFWSRPLFLVAANIVESVPVCLVQKLPYNRNPKLLIYLLPWIVQMWAWLVITAQTNQMHWSRRQLLSAVKLDIHDQLTGVYMARADPGCHWGSWQAAAININKVY